jgi:protoporphyrinogen oxidase
MKKLHAETLIIGAGPAGLAAAMELSRAGKDFIIMEKQPVVGGLAKTYTFKEGDLTFKTDNGPHRFFSKNPYLYEFIEDLLDEKWITVKRQTRQFIDGKFYDYPVNAAQALRNIGPVRSVRIILDYGVAKLRFGLLKKPIRNFDDYVVSNFGRHLAEFNMINYTEKIWGIPATTIHADWAGQRIKGLSLSSLVADTVKRVAGVNSANKPKTLIDTFYYPQFGTGLIYDTIVARITKAGHQLLLNTRPKAVRHKDHTITEVVADSPDGEITITFDNLVESVPLTEFVELMQPALPKPVLAANSKLRHRSQVYVFVTLDKPSVTADQWIYFPDRSTPIARMSEMRNFSSELSPPGKTSLFIELFCFEDDETWKRTDAQLFDLVADYLIPLGFFAREEVRHSYVLREKNVYPVYDVDYQHYLSQVKAELNRFKNLYYIGRPGRFRYNNQDHSLEMGIMAATSIIEGKRQDLESVGSEKDYFEGGNLKAARKTPGKKPTHTMTTPAPKAAKKTKKRPTATAAKR